MLQDGLIIVSLNKWPSIFSFRARLHWANCPIPKGLSSSTKLPVIDAAEEGIAEAYKELGWDLNCQLMPGTALDDVL